MYKSCCRTHDHQCWFYLAEHDSIHPELKVYTLLREHEILHHREDVCSVSTVYRGVCSATLRPVIIKCYIKAKMKPKNFTRMEREIRLMKFLSQSDLMCQFYGSFESENHKYIIMEHCRGGDLFKFMLMRGGNLPEPWVATQVPSALCLCACGVDMERIPDEVSVAPCSETGSRRLHGLLWPPHGSYTSPARALAAGMAAPCVQTAFSHFQRASLI